ncbi:MAG: cellulase family glycosylhydrolase [Ruminococcus sp.]|nr:cellulase family glycosylhydrolase [Ruminococcus sp.]
MKNNRKRLISAALALFITVSGGCGANNSEPDIGSSSAAPAVTAETDAVPEESKSEAVSTLDPLDDDYDPYGGGGAATQVVTSLKLENRTEEETETASVSVAETVVNEDKPQTSKTETTARSETAAAEKITEPPEKETSAAKTEAAAKEEETVSEDVSLEISVPNGWSDGTADYSQIDGTVKNSGKKDVNGWIATVTLSASATVEQSWNCGIELKNGVMTITPVEHNRSITPGGEGSFGMIIKNPGKIDAEKSTLSCSFGTYQASGGGQADGGSGSGTAVPYSPAKDVPAPTTDDWLSVSGNKIVDSSGREVWLTGVNWFGYNTGTNTFDGLWACDLNSSLASIADHGFNLLRVPISAELVNNWENGNYPEANYNHATNSYLNGMNSLEIFDYSIGQCRANGLKIMIDIHSAKTDSMGHMKNMWYEGNVSESDYLAALSWLAERYKDDDTVIAYDLKNEPHGKANETPRAKWDNSKDADNWKYIAEKAANAVLSKNPNVLVMVEGIEIYPKDIKSNGDFSSTDPGDYYSTWWGGNLRGVKDNPVDLGKYRNKLVYSPHDYGPAVYEQEWFKGDYTYQSLCRDAWNDNWLYIHDSGTAPLLIGEWGGFMTQPNLKWMTYLRQLIAEKKINHTFWCFNSNSGDTGGLVKDDFTTWDNEKYEFVKEVLWQEDGKFVGLDHQIPLGSNGKALN